MHGAAVRLAVAAVVLISAPDLQTRQRVPTARTVRGGVETPPFVVIVNKANPVKTLAVAELRRIFMKQTRMWPHAESIVPVDWDATSPLRETFSKQVLARSVREMGDYWVQQSVTQGLAPPSTQRSTRALLRFVASVAGAIGYVPAGEADETVSVIKITGL
jgi:ABC-type phosphate transport system substrate-binding protein